MDGATSNSVRVQNRFETAEAGGTGVLGGGRGRPGQRGLKETTALLQSHRQDLSSAASWAIMAEKHGVPQGICASTLSPDAVSTGHPARRRRRPAGVPPRHCDEEIYGLRCDLICPSTQWLGRC